MIENQHTQPWHEMLSCPNCGENYILDDTHINSQGACSICHCTWSREDNILIWEDQLQKKIMQQWKVILKKIKNQFNPMSSWISPIRLIDYLLTEKYYRRTLCDKTLAKKWHDHYVKGLNLHPGDIILDLGCGRGRITALSNQMGFYTVGQDVRKNTWWKKINKSGFQATSKHHSKLPWRNSTFSAVLSFYLLHYLDEKQIQTYLKEILRVLKPNGYLILLEANSNGYATNMNHKQMGHLHTLNAIRHIYQPLGFKELSLEYEGFYAPVFPLFINFIRKLFSLKSFDISDFGTRIESIIPPERRALWLLKLQKPGCTNK